MNHNLERPSPEQAALLAMSLDLAAGDIVAVEGGILTKVHPGSACAGRNCWIHNPSDHAMRSWPIRWRADKHTAERVCQHDIGHPDPDELAFHTQAGCDLAAHACDGCCARP